MQSNKKPMLVAALAVAVIALVGAGYAAVTNYTATTTNGNNDLSSTFITVEQGGAAAYGTTDAASWLTGIYFDTVNTAQNTNTYTLVKEWIISSASIIKPTDDTPATMAVACKELTIDVKGKNSQDTSISIDVTASDFTKVDGLNYKLVLAKGATFNASTGVFEGATEIGTPVSATVSGTEAKWSFTETVVADTLNDAGYKYFVLLLIDGDPSASVTPGQFAGFEDSSFTFVVTADDA